MFKLDDQIKKYLKNFDKEIDKLKDKLREIYGKSYYDDVVSDFRIKKLLSLFKSVKWSSYSHTSF